MTSKILSPNTDQELSQILNQDPYRILVLIYSTAWCKNCKRLNAGLERLAETLSKVATFVHVDLDVLEEAPRVYKIENTPTFQFLRGPVLQSTINARQLPKKATPKESDDQLLVWIEDRVRSFAANWNRSYSKITDHLAFSPSVTEKEIVDGLTKVGFKTVIAMESKEDPTYLPKEADLWKAHGIGFTHYPIKNVDEIGLHDFDEMLQLIESQPGPILIHSDIGQTAAVFVFASVAKQHDRPGHEVATWAKELGFDFEGLGRLTTVISTWVDSKS
ncbi:hypothetical protein DFQ27_002268 [Actinomortierella ambigua]|uniref:Thioredoxin domain-containing protein n=1 Tax=Actinomortierella ambigua TaxID=1343610 RepID=A0A9P6U6G4_9FUNG|nr:hypothetical protein DFQ27_002268 [Actinomortierella ambigua]